MLSGAAYGTELGDMENGPVSGTDGHFFMAFNVDFFVDLDKFTSRVDKAIQQVQTPEKHRESNGSGCPVSVNSKPAFKILNMAYRWAKKPSATSFQPQSQRALMPLHMD